MRISDWSSDVCSSDLPRAAGAGDHRAGREAAACGARIMRALLFVLSVLLLAAPALAVEPSAMLDDPVLEQRARDLSAEIRFVVCQNESNDSSKAALAPQLRVLVRQRQGDGTSDQ